MAAFTALMGLIKDNGFSLNGSVGGVSGGIKFADNSLTCDSEGNCMLKDHLATNALTCDSEGNCMLKDNLMCFSTNCKDKKAKKAAVKAEIAAA